jgi:hypothetical protein
MQQFSAMQNNMMALNGTTAPTIRDDSGTF